MGSFISSTGEEQLEMLHSLGYESFAELFGHVPEQVKLKKELNLPKGLSELETAEKIGGMAAKNTVFFPYLPGSRGI